MLIIRFQKVKSFSKTAGQCSFYTIHGSCHVTNINLLVFLIVFGQNGALWHKENHQKETYSISGFSYKNDT